MSWHQGILVILNFVEMTRWDKKALSDKHDNVFIDCFISYLPNWAHFWRLMAHTCALCSTPTESSRTRLWRCVMVFTSTLTWIFIIHLYFCTVAWFSHTLASASGVIQQFHLCHSITTDIKHCHCNVLGF